MIATPYVHHVVVVTTLLVRAHNQQNTKQRNVVRDDGGFTRSTKIKKLVSVEEKYSGIYYSLLDAVKDQTTLLL